MAKSPARTFGQDLMRGEHVVGGDKTNGGVLMRVTSDGRTVEYGNAADLLSRVRIIESEMAQIVGSPLPVAGFAGFRRGAR